MEFIIHSNHEKIDWHMLTQLISDAGLVLQTATKYEKAFRNSYKCIYVFKGEELVGCGRIISDGIYQAAMYDVVVHPEYQGLGLGKKIVLALMQGEEHLKIILYAAKGKEDFYNNLGFSPLARGMEKNRSK